MIIRNRRGTEPYARWCELTITHKAHDCLARLQPSVKSANLFHPRHSASVPGGPSLFLAKYPPSLAIHTSASAMVGETAGGLRFLEDLIDSTVHSCSERNCEQGKDGFVRAINVIMNNLHPTMLMTVR